VKLTFGFLANKTRSGIAERLKDGDVTDEECRRLIVREFDDIKSKLDGLARKDLLSSLCFLQEGINRLDQSLFQLDSNEDTAESKEEATLAEATTSRHDIHSRHPDSPVKEAVALINAITSLKIHSKERFKLATESFKIAREKATEAFCNEALSIEDRIQASQIRMMARILECLEDPVGSVSDCLQYLKQLHDIGAIQEIFQVIINGGIKSRFNKTKRLDNVSSVHLMNQILFNFARKFTKLPLRYLDWPMIFFGKKGYHPVFGEPSLVAKLKEFGVQVMSLNPDFTFDDKISPGHSVVNSRGKIVNVALTQDARKLKIFKCSDESRHRILCEVFLENHACTQCISAMDIDTEDNIYLITLFRECDGELWSFKLIIFEENGNKKLELPLSFHQSSYEGVSMIVNRDRKIFILNCETKVLYIGSVSVELNLFEVARSLSLSEIGMGFLPSLRFADFSGTKIIAADLFNLYIYTENGQLHRKIRIPEKLRYIDSFAINHVMKCILVKTHDSSGRILLSFSENGELIDSLCLGSEKWIEYAKLTSHHNGPIALVGKKGAALLKL
jgi:hypothetical protein